MTPPVPTPVVGSDTFDASLEYEWPWPKARPSEALLAASTVQRAPSAISTMAAEAVEILAFLVKNASGWTSATEGSALGKLHGLAGKGAFVGCGKGPMLGTAKEVLLNNDGVNVTGGTPVGLGPAEGTLEEEEGLADSDGGRDGTS